MGLEWCPRSFPFLGRVLPSGARMFSRGFLLSWLLALAGTGVTAMLVAAQDEVIDQEYALKAVYLYNFGRYVEWPKNAVPGAGNTFIIGVLGPNPFGRTLL